MLPSRGESVLRRIDIISICFGFAFRQTWQHFGIRHQTIVIQYTMAPDNSLLKPCVTQHGETFRQKKYFWFGILLTVPDEQCFLANGLFKVFLTSKVYLRKVKGSLKQCQKSQIAIGSEIESESDLEHDINTILKLVLQLELELEFRFRLRLRLKLRLRWKWNWIEIETDIQFETIFEIEVELEIVLTGNSGPRSFLLSQGIYIAHSPECRFANACGLNAWARNLRIRDSGSLKGFSPPYSS